MYFYDQERSDERNYLYCRFDTDLNFSLYIHKNFEFATAFCQTTRISIKKLKNAKRHYRPQKSVMPFRFIQIIILASREKHTINTIFNHKYRVYDRY